MNDIFTPLLVVGGIFVVFALMKAFMEPVFSILNEMGALPYVLSVLTIVSGVVVPRLFKDSESVVATQYLPMLGLAATMLGMLGLLMAFLKSMRGKDEQQKGEQAS